MLLSACATAAPPPAAPAVGYEQKMAWILELEDRRILRVPPPPPPVEALPPRGARRAAVVPPPPAVFPDLGELVRDSEARVRRRAALAIGRVKLPDGVALLTATLADADPEVRAMAAFALGLIGDASAEPALTALLADGAPLVRGRAAEGLGLIGATAAAAAIGQMTAEYARAPAVAAMQPDDESWPAAAEAEAFKLGLFALVRLRAFEPLAAAVLDHGRPISSWWPVAYALQRVEDKRAVPALLELLRGSGRYTRAFAVRGVGVLKEPSATPLLLALLDPSAPSEPEVTVAAVRALAQIGAPEAGKPLARLAGDPAIDSNVRLEAVTALGALQAHDSVDVIHDLITDTWPHMRAAALQAAATADPEAFIAILAGVEPDRHWRVRAALATALGGLAPDLVLERVMSMLGDEDKRVIPAVLASLVRLGAPDVRTILRDRLNDPDYVVRAAAARQIGRMKRPEDASLLRAAYDDAGADSAYGARASALEALVELGAAAATDVLRAALADKDWAIRVRAADLLAKFDPDADLHEAIRPMPMEPVVGYDDSRLIGPPYSPRVFIDTARGGIELELAVLDAPQTARNFMALARRGFFNGLEVHRVVANFVVQDGDPRGDGEGGPGYTIRDELNDRPYLRGTVGMALNWRDTGGSQFFITHSPQPHLDGRYTVFGRVVNGMDVVDRIRPGDVIQRVRVWDGTGQ